MNFQKIKIFLTFLFISIFVCGATAIFCTSIAFAQDKVSQTTCLVMAGAINKDIYVDFQGQRIYFCCEGCKKNFFKDPEKYMQKVDEQKILLESVQKKCPVTGKDIDKKIYTDYKGRRVYFCCLDCIEKFKKEPEKYLKVLNSETDVNAKLP